MLLLTYSFKRILINESFKDGIEVQMKWLVPLQPILAFISNYWLCDERPTNDLIYIMTREKNTERFTDLDKLNLLMVVLGLSQFSLLFHLPQNKNARIKSGQNLLKNDHIASLIRDTQCRLVSFVT